MRWAAWTNLVAGLCLIAAPFATGYWTVHSTATLEAVVLGVLIAAFAGWSAWSHRVPTYVDYVLSLFGVWSIVAPFAFGYRELQEALYADIIVGLVVLVTALVKALYGTRTLHPRAA